MLKLSSVKLGSKWSKGTVWKFLVWILHLPSKLFWNSLLLTLFKIFGVLGLLVLAKIESVHYNLPLPLIATKVLDKVIYQLPGDSEK